MLLDLDGTIADTEPVWLDAKARVARRHRIVWSEADGLASVGQPTPVYAAEFARRGAAASAERIAEEITEEVVAGLGAGIVWRPGALHLLATAAANDVPTALVTMAYRPIAEAVRELTGLPVFSVIVAGDDVERTKPHPEPYLLALERLGAPDPSLCVAIEDTLVGALSAEAAGLHTVVVPSGAVVPPAPRRTFFASLEEVRLDDLLRQLRR